MRVLLLVLLFVIGMCALIVFADDTASAMPTSSQLEQERARVEQQRKILFNENNPALKNARNVMPTDEQLRVEQEKVDRERKILFDANNPDLKNTKNVFPNIPTPERSGINPEDVAKQYEKRIPAPKKDDLLVFASLSMPTEAFRKMVKDAQQVGGTVVLRGFKNDSWKQTIADLQALNINMANIVINPNAFKKYKISQVPVTLLIKSENGSEVDTEGCALPSSFIAVPGDVTLAYALENIEKQSPEFESIASRYRRGLRE